jgi:hypothetical protein
MRERERERERERRGDDSMSEHIEAVSNSCGVNLFSNTTIQTLTLPIVKEIHGSGAGRLNA